MQPEGTDNFYGLGIAPSLLEALERLHLKTPTPIQSRAIPIAIEGSDLVGVAQTGTGKTMAFGIPMLQRLAHAKGQGLVLLPTRELAAQVEESLRNLGAHAGLRTAMLIGGAAIGPQIQALRRNPHIIIATPGRLIDHLEQKTIKLNAVSILVLDEADRMLDMGFMPQIRRILDVLPKTRQTMLFSATMPLEITRIAASYMRVPTRVEIAPSGTTAERVTQELFIVPRDEKSYLLLKLLETYRGPALVFVRTKYGAKRIAHNLKIRNVNAAEIHSNRSLSQRQEALAGFKSGKYRVLVATDIAARGIDVEGIELVLNYDLPSTAEDYVHRIGRTARAGQKGHAVSFAMPDEGREVRSIERLIRKPIPVARIEAMPHMSLEKFAERSSPHSRPLAARTGKGWRFQPRPRRPGFGR